MSSGNTSDYRKVALAFTKLLALRDYLPAYTMTSQEYRNKATMEQMQASFETIVPTDWGGIENIEVGHTMTTWPGKKSSDLGWVYVSIGGNVYCEAVTVVVSSDNCEAKIREVEFGRP